MALVECGVTVNELHTTSRGHCVILKDRRMVSASSLWPTADDAVHGNEFAREWALEL